MRVAAILLCAAVALAGCGEGDVAVAPPPMEPTQNATGYYCNMTVVEHKGPKGHIFVAGRKEPIWFTSVRDTIAFTLLPEEPKDLAAVYVNDMAKATNWDAPDAGAWMKAADAHYVIGSKRLGGMGAPESVPFSDHGKAMAFAKDHGGRVVALADIPRDFILGDPNESQASHGTAASAHAGHTDETGAMEMAKDGQAMSHQGHGMPASTPKPKEHTHQ